MCVSRSICTCLYNNLFKRECVCVCERHTLFCVLYIPYYSPQAVYFTISCSALHHPVKLNTHRSTVEENLFTCVFSRFFFPTGQLEDLRLPWELAPGPSPLLKLSSSKPWWLQPTVGPIPCQLFRPSYEFHHLFSKPIYCSSSHQDAWEVVVCLASCLVGEQQARLSHW